MNPILRKAICAATLLIETFCSQANAQSALLNDGAVVYLENAASLYVQGALETKTTGSFTNNGTIHISGHLIHNASGNLNSISAGTFRFNGTSNQQISGSGTNGFYNLTIDKSGGELQLQTGIRVSNQLALTNGNLFLNNQLTDLLTSGSIVGETGTRRIYDNVTNNGTIRVTQTLNAPSAVNPGNLGAIITSSQNLGATTITRGHHQQFIVSANSIARYYDIAATNNSGLNATLRFNYFDNELNGQTESELIQWYSPNYGTTWNKAAGTVNTSSNYVDRTTISSFQRISLISYNITALPVKLLSFTANKNAADKVDLAWTTTEEINTSHFDIERSADGRQWERIGRKTALNRGTYTNNYTFTDANPFSGANYYRLRMQDFDDHHEYSPVRMVTIGKTSGATVYPTLAVSGQQLFITGITPSNASIEVFDNRGRLLQKERPSANSFNLVQLAAGIYHIRITNTSTGELAGVQKIVIH
ncbi:MAG TPA: T9SS type A sorting domain-containing protein [Chitinophagaceae bacterium]|jgi:hypothetical protein|nr:T9SS type A sorting domain-containing protein [Chitinophagaceae bacterium]